MDYWIVKLDNLGNLEWQKSFGGSGYDEACSVQRTPDGGYIVAGSSTSNDGDVLDNHGSEDFWIVKLDSSGIFQWQKCLGGSLVDHAYSIQHTTDGGFIVAGSTRSNNDNVSGWHAGYSNSGIPTDDYWVVKLDSLGNIQWQKCLGGSDDEIAKSIQQTTDGGFIVAGYAYSNDGDVSGNHGNGDYWIIKLDSSGNLQWQKCLGGSNLDRTYSIQQITDGGFIVAGFSDSNDDDVSGTHGPNDFWIVKIDTNGNIVWQKCLGGSCGEAAISIEKTADEGFIVAGWTCSIDGDVSGWHPGYYYDYYGYPHYDSWIVKLDSSGNLQWQKCLGGSDEDAAFCIQQTVDGGFVVAGSSRSNDGDVSGNRGDYDYWIVKLGTTTGIDNTPIQNSQLTIFPNPTDGVFTLSLTLSEMKQGEAHIEVINLLGQIVLSEKARVQEGKLQKEISLLNVSEGMYLLKVTINYAAYFAQINLRK